MIIEPFIPKMIDIKPKHMIIPEKHIDISKKLAPCPTTGAICKRHRYGHRTVRHLDYIAHYKTSVHYSKIIAKYFTIQPPHAIIGCKYGNDVYQLIESMYQYPLKSIKWYLNENYGLLIRESSIHDIKKKTEATKF